MGKKHNDDLNFDLPPSDDTAFNQPYDPGASQNFGTNQSFGLNPDMSSPTNNSPFSPQTEENTSYSTYTPPSMPSPGRQMAQNYIQKSEVESGNEAHMLEVINLKLDAIRSELNSLGHRLAALEQKSGDQKRGW